MSENSYQPPAPNAEQDYCDYRTGGLIWTIPFYDPGRDPKRKEYPNPVYGGRALKEPL